MMSTVGNTKMKVAVLAAIALPGLVSISCVKTACADGNWIIASNTSPVSGTEYPCPAGSYDDFTNNNAGTTPEETCTSASQGSNSSAVGETVSISWSIQWSNTDGRTPTPDQAFKFTSNNNIGGSIGPSGTQAASAGANAGDESQQSVIGYFNKSDTETNVGTYAYQEQGSVGAITSANPDWSGDPQHENPPISTEAAAQGSMSVSVVNTPATGPGAS